MLTLLGYSQIINDPTNFEPNKLPTCIDHIFTSQPNLVLESGFLPSLCRTCHHQIIFAKICFKVHLPPIYEREVWHYNRARGDLIKRSIQNVNWDRAFLDHNVNDQVEIFTNTLFNIFRNFIPHETIKVRSKDPPWINNEIKTALRCKNRLYKKYITGDRKREDEINLHEMTVYVSNLIIELKNSYFISLGKRLNNK